MTQEKPAQNGKTMILWGLLVASTIMLAPFGISLIIGGFPDNSSSSNCYEQVSQEIAKREGNKSVERSDVERYHRELTIRCK